jgi:50S ribosomal protein L16 3-hydroxylase
MRLTAIGDISTEQFLRDYWGKQALLIRGAFDFKSVAPPIDKATLLKLTTHDDLVSRLIQQMPSKTATLADVNAGKWQLDEGPFDAGFFESAEAKREAKKGVKFTVLVQDTQHVHAGAEALLQQFSFIPHARLDDLMVSYAIDGAGVGAHVDSYDVFLLQGWGKRRWQWGHQSDLSLLDETPVKLLKSFVPEFDEVLEPGDMLYLPAGWAHHGVAVGECLTYSIGFRAPAADEVRDELFNMLGEASLAAAPLVSDTFAELNSPAKGKIPASLRKQIANCVSEVLSLANSEAAMNALTGRVLTLPKVHVEFDAPAKPHTLASFTKAAAKSGLALHAKSRALYDDAQFYLNGAIVAGSLTPGLCALADNRFVTAEHVDTALAHRLFKHYESGEITLRTLKLI